MNFEQITKKVQNLIDLGHPVLIAVSGFGGSGKTTLAKSLRNHFEDSTLLQLDNFLVNHGDGEGWMGGYDWQRFEQVLKDIRAGKDLHYQWYDWDKNETKNWINQPLPSLIIVEGVRIFQSNLKKYYDLTIWIERSLEESTTQGKIRDNSNKTNENFNLEAHIQKWDKIWVPKEKEFVAIFDPIHNADILYAY